MEIEFYPSNEGEFKRECSESGKVYYILYKNDRIINSKIRKVNALWNQTVRNNIQTDTMNGQRINDMQGNIKVRAFASDDFLQDKGTDLEKILFADDFYFAKIQPLWQKFLSCEINDIDDFINEIKTKWDELGKIRYKSIELLNYFEGSKKEALDLLNQMIAIFDKHAAKKVELNPYKDKRVIADSNVRQDDWIFNLLRIKNKQDATPSIQNAVDYIKNPQEVLNIYSEEHRKQIANKLLKKQYLKDEFTKDLIRYFEENNIYHEVKNEKNLTMFMTKILYHTLKDKWHNQDNKQDKESKMSKTKIPLNQIPLNQILFGPPGTGKTYSTVGEALKILEATNEQKQTIKSIVQLKEVFKSRVEFVTFHQSFSYEDFVEGLKANTDDGKIIYEIENGVFKEICENAKQTIDNNFDEAYQKLIKQITDNDYERVELKTLKKKKVFYVNVNSKGSLVLHTGDKKSQQGSLTKDRIYKIFSGEPINGGWECYFGGVVKHLKDEFDLKDYQETTERKPHQKTTERKPHVLIIDEINRGNISRIFGELITLIEPNKRAGEAEEISVKLPYSKTDFSVPNNLYIIGTMNTADRSLALMDTALRRRFDFIEMMPKDDLVKDDVEGINVQKILKNINSRIEVLYDREHTIGHSFLMNVENLEQLRDVFKNKILPLLEEYFYDDFEKIKSVLADTNDNFYQKNKPDKHLFSGMEIDIPNKDIYQRNDNELAAVAFRGIYENKNDQEQ